jgi:leucyl-tRNA synthetase
MVIMLAPMAPHLAEEAWQTLGGSFSIFQTARWPAWDEDLIRTDSIELPVQVNGRLRATITVQRGASEDDVRAAALREESVRRHIGEGTIRKTVHVPDRLLNLVVG